MKRKSLLLLAIIAICASAICGCESYEKYKVFVEPAPGNGAIAPSETLTKTQVITILPFGDESGETKYDLAKRFSKAVEKEFKRWDYYIIMPQGSIFRHGEEKEFALNEENAAKIGRAIKADAVVWGSILSYKRDFAEKLDYFTNKLFDTLTIELKIEMKMIRSSDGAVLWRKIYTAKAEHRQPADWMLSVESMLRVIEREFARAVSKDLMPPIPKRKDTPVKK